MDHERLLELIEKMESETATEAELQELDALYEAFETRENYIDGFDAQERALFGERMFERISAKTNPDSLQRQKGSIYKLWPRIAAAASILLMVSISGYFLLHKPKEAQDAHNKIYAHDVGPGSNGAILTLSNGKQVVLDQAAKGKIAQQGNTALQKAGDSLLIYKGTNGNTTQDAPLAYNTLTTPRGKQFKVVLPDGSVAFLNAASELRYPVAFTGSERKVELKGEAYFEVTKNKAMPFTVHTAKGDIQVLGTHFNIMAYANEPDMRATLLEGSVKVNAAGESRLIVPGQQAVINDHIKVAEVNVDEVTAWKNGLFRFNETPTGDVMRQLERWYDVQIDDNALPMVHFNGGIPRNSNLSSVLHMLSVTGNIRFEINGQKVSISKANPN